MNHLNSPENVLATNSHNNKNILFIIPPYFNFQSLNSDRLDSIPVFTVPYGILSIVSYLRKYSLVELDIDLIDLNLEAFEYLSGKESPHSKPNVNNSLYETVRNKLLEKDYDIVGLSALFNNAYKYIEDLSNVVKSTINPPLFIIGGGLASNLPHEILKNFENVDAICLAEGEIPMLDLLNSKNMQSSFNTSNSWITREKIKKEFTFKASYIENLDEIPILEYDLIDLKKYNGRSVDKRYANSLLKKEFSIHTSRGCPYKCIYCSNTSIHGKIIRKMSISRITSELDSMIDNYGMNVLLIEDDHFLADTDRAKAVLKEIAKRNIRVEFPNGISVRGIDYELSIALKNAGVSAVNLAVESGSDFVLSKLIRKPHLSKHIKPAVQFLRDQDIRVHAFIVLGLPGELPEHRLETAEMIQDVGFDWVYFFLAVPIVGSRLYNQCIENNYIVENDFSKHLISNATIKAPGIDPSTISDEMYHMNLDANFVNNWNLKNNRHEIALPYFESMVRKYPSHAFAYYVLIQIYTFLNYSTDKIKELSNKYNDIINKDKNWKNHSETFKLKTIRCKA